MIAEKFLNRRFDDLMTVAKGIKRGLTTRHMALTPSNFEGRRYTPEEFHRFTAAFFDDPGGFYQDFNAPGAAPELHGEEAFEHGVVRDWSMPSGVTGPDPENNRIQFKQVVSSVGEGRGTLFLLPGWLSPRVNVELGICRDLAAHGIGALVMSPPFSQQRTPAGWASGLKFVSGDVYATVANFRQCVSDALGVLNWARRDGFSPGRAAAGITLAGISLGGVLVQLISNVFAAERMILIISGCQLGDIVWDGKLTRRLKRDIIRGGIGREELNRVWAILDPKHMGGNCLVPRENIRLLASKYDQIIHPPYQQRLWEALGRPERHQYNSAHYSVAFHLKDIKARIVNLMTQ